MSDILESRSARPRPEPDQARTLETLTTLLLVAFVVTVLYVGRDIFIPIAIAIVVSFVLSPPILLLRRWGLGRVPSVFAVVLAALVIAFLISAVLTRQVSALAVDLPKYQATINAKINHLRDAAADNALFVKISTALKTIGEINPHRLTSANPTAPLSQPKNPPVPVEVHEPEPGPFTIVQTIAGTALSPLETIFIVVVFVIFILLQREDLRNRFIRLAGARDLQRTTLAMDDAAARLSRFFLVQTLVNATFGVIVAVGLYFIGLPSPILWGMVAFLLRFVPYIGPFLAAGFPVVLAAAIDPDWGTALATLALFLLVEPIIGQGVEPWLYGHHTGISPVAVVISATFWTWLWGAVGLVLSTPLTVCLVVLGRHVERLAFLEVIFGDAPPLTPVENFYQRVLAGDASEVVDQAERFLKHNSLIEYYDEVALPALLMAQADLRRGVLDEPRQRRIKETVDEVIEDLSDHADEPPTEESAPEALVSEHSAGSSAPAVKASLPAVPNTGLTDKRKSEQPVLCIAGRSFLDEAAAALFAQTLMTRGIVAKVESAGLLTAARMSRLSAEDVQLVCLSYFDADLSPAGARFAVRRLRRRLGGIQILAGFWQGDPEKVNNLCTVIKADHCVTSLKDAVAFCFHEELEDAEASETVAKPVAKTLEGAAEKERRLITSSHLMSVRARITPVDRFLHLGAAFAGI